MNILDLRYQRPSVSTAACAPAHEWLMGRLETPGITVDRPSLAKFQEQLPQEKSVQPQGAQLQGPGIDTPATNGSMAKSIGMAKTPAAAGAGASGVPPRGRPV